MACLLKFVGEVSADDFVEVECIVPDGTHTITTFGVSLVGDRNLKAEFYFDDTLLYVAHETHQRICSEPFEADGVKKMRIKVVNSTAQTETVSAYMEGY